MKKQAIQRTQNGDLAAVRDMARRLAKDAPGLADLSPAQLDAVAKAVILDGLKADMKARVDLARISYQGERRTFLAHAAGRTHSEHTRRAYGAALDRLDAWTAKRGIEPLAIKPRDADDYAYALAAEGRAAGSVRRDIAAASSFFTWLERRHDSIRNPFRGTKARPVRQATKETVVPDAEDLAMILGAAKGQLKAAAVVMNELGLRVGALPTMTVRAGRYQARSKGHDIAGELPPVVLQALRHLDARAPFGNTTASQLADNFRYLVRGLVKAGKVKARYSVHDLRHAFAVREYRKNKDIHRLKTLLGHASIQVTENYLKGLGAA